MPWSSAPVLEPHWRRLFITDASVVASLSRYRLPGSLSRRYDGVVAATRSCLRRNVLPPAVARLHAPAPHHQDLNDHKADHQPEHARQLIGRHQPADEIGRADV